MNANELIKPEVFILRTIKIVLAPFTALLFMTGSVLSCLGIIGNRLCRAIDYFYRTKTTVSKWSFKDVLNPSYRGRLSDEDRVKFGG